MATIGGYEGNGKRRLDVKVFRRARPSMRSLMQRGGRATLRPVSIVAAASGVRAPPNR